MPLSSGSTLQQTDEVAAVAPGSAEGGGGGGVSGWDDLTGELSGPVPFDATDDDGNPTSRSLQFLNVTPQVDVTSDPANGVALEIKDQTNGNRLGTLTTDGRWETRADQEAFADGSFASGSSTNSLLQVEDAGTVLTTDAASLNFTGSGLSLTQNGDEITVDVSGGSGSDIDIEDNQSVVVGGATGLSFEGSGIDDVTNDGDGTATVKISKGSSTEIQEGGTPQVSDVTVLDFVGSDFSVATPTGGEAEVSLQNDSVTVAGNSVPLGGATSVNHSDLSGISSNDHHAKTTSAADLTDVSADSVTDAHHTRPSAGDGLSDSSNTFSVNESQVDHDSLNQFVANEHVDHSAVTISAGTALSGGGDLTASRALNVAGPLTGIPFKTTGDDLEWQADANNDLILQNTTDAQTLLKVDQDTGTVFAAGDVVAFGLSGGGGSGSTSGLQADAPLTLDTTTDPDTIGLSVGSGLTVTNGTLEADGSVGVSSVFGRTGDVVAEDGDYDASQIDGFDSAAVSAVESTYINNTTGEKWDVSLSSGEVLWDINAHRSYELKRETGTSSNSAAANLVFNSRVGGNAWEFAYNDTTLLELGGGDGIQFEKLPFVNGNAVWHAGNDGPSSGLNADKVDGYEGSDLAVLSEDETITGTWEFDGEISVYKTGSPTSYRRMVITRSEIRGDEFTSTSIYSRGNNNDEGLILGNSEPGEADKPMIKAHLNGNVGIGDPPPTSPSYALEISGDARASGEVEAFLGSDRRLKTELDPLDSALDKVDQLTGYGFDWRDQGAVQPHKRGETDVGLIAQEVEEVVPQAVREFQDGHSEGYKSVSYDKLVPLLIEAIKDLRSQIEQVQ